MSRSLHIAEARRKIEQGTDEMRFLADPESLSPFSVMFYGAGGRLGSAAIVNLLNRSHEFPQLTVIAAYHTRNEQLQKATELQARVIAPNVKFHSIQTDGAAEYIRNTNLCIVTAACAPKLQNRIEMCKRNLKLVPDLARLAQLSPNTLFHYATALGEVIAQAVQNNTRGNPYQHSALGNSDKRRLDMVVIGHMAKEGYAITETESFCVGHHNDPWAVPGNRFYDEKKHIIIPKTISEKVRRDMSRVIKEHPEILWELMIGSGIDDSPSGKEVSAALIDDILAIRYGGRLINAAVYMNGKYLLAPTGMEKGALHPNIALLSRLDDIDRHEFEKREHDLEEILRGVGVNTHTRHPTQYETADPAEVHMYMPAERTTQAPLETNVQYRYVPPLLDRVKDSVDRVKDCIENVYDTTVDMLQSGTLRKAASIALTLSLLAGGIYGIYVVHDYMRDKDAILSRQVFPESEIQYGAAKLRRSRVMSTHYSPDKKRGIMVYEEPNVVTDARGIRITEPITSMFVYNTEGPTNLRDCGCVVQVLDLWWTDNDTIELNALSEKRSDNTKRKVGTFRFDVDNFNEAYNRREVTAKGENLLPE
ncbi:MAG TPA: hypothetical protein VJB66_01540 [Candidatus Nanoarchaeia archaeon]|nr:hypothetical protein [Candidatus Nanoarchaeia archaeon]